MPAFKIFNHLYIQRQILLVIFTSGSIPSKEQKHKWQSTFWEVCSCILKYFVVDKKCYMQEEPVCGNRYIIYQFKSGCPMQVIYHNNIMNSCKFTTQSNTQTHYQQLAFTYVFLLISCPSHLSRSNHSEFCVFLLSFLRILLAKLWY